MLLQLLTIATVFCLKCQSTLVYSDVMPQCVAVTAPICVHKSSTMVEEDIHSQITGPRSNQAKTEGMQNEQALSWPYNSTTFPSFADDKSESEVAQSLSALHMLVSTTCSKYIKIFLCAVHSPVCTDRGVVPPCKELCEQVRLDCLEVLETFGIEWPHRLDCAYFPRMKQTNQSVTEQNTQSAERSTDAGDMILISRSASLLWSDALLDGGSVCIPTTDEDVVTPVLRRLEKESHNASTVTNAPEENVDYGVSCPAEMRTPPSQSSFNFMGLANCSAPCPNMYLDRNELSVVRGLICAQSALYVIVTSFVLLTFAIDTKRFRYPERPIVFYAFSYLVVSIVFLVGFGAGEQVACHDKIVNEDNEILQGFAVVQGATKRTCTVMFMVLHFFTVSGTIWWLLLTITWLLAAGFKWGSEAIEKRWIYFHAVAWTVPSFQTLIVAVWNKIEGDNVAGVCFVGVYDNHGLYFLLLAPMALYLIIGIVALLTGFFCINRAMKGFENDDRQKLVKFMLRIGVFSILFILPQLALIVVYVVEGTNRKYWEASWYARSCTKFAVPCPVQQDVVGQLAMGDSRPGVFIFLVKYTMMLIAALPPLFWVASRKTLRSWARFFSSAPWKRSELETSATQVRLLTDSNGPHAKDRDAKVRKMMANQTTSATFGDFRNGGLRGSSASVVVHPMHSAYALQETWDDSTDLSSSTTASSLSSIIAHDMKRNMGQRVVGRRTRHAPTNSSHIVARAAANSKRRDDIIGRVMPQKINSPNGGLNISETAGRSVVHIHEKASPTNSKQISEERKASLSCSHDSSTRKRFENHPTLQFKEKSALDVETADTTKQVDGHADLTVRLNDKEVLPGTSTLIVHIPNTDQPGPTATLSPNGSTASCDVPKSAIEPPAPSLILTANSPANSAAAEPTNSVMPGAKGAQSPPSSVSSPSSTLTETMLRQKRCHSGDRKPKTPPPPPPRLESISTTSNTERVLSL